MDFNQFGDNLEDSTNFLIEKLSELHPWDDEWKYDIAVKLVPIYVEEIYKFKEYLAPINMRLQEEGRIVTHRDLLRYLKDNDEDNYRKALEQHFEVYKIFISQKNNTGQQLKDGDKKKKLP